MFNALKRLALDYHHRTSRLPQGERVCASLTKQIRHAESLLDVGCGDGQNTLRFANAVGATRVEGVDILIRANPVIDVKRYDGRHLPFPDKSFDVVTIVDVLHHCEDMQAVLTECVRVAKEAVAIKDHFKFGKLTDKMLYWMDIAGNAKDGIPSPGNFLHPREWVELVEKAGGTIVSLDWPLKTHDLPWRLVGWPELQFTARIEPRRAQNGQG
jgi:SAM-dependent methyltransferase